MTKTKRIAISLIASSIMMIFFVACSKAHEGQRLNKSNAHMRDSYRFKASLSQPTGGGEYNGIIVKGYIGNDNSPNFECEHELAASVDAASHKDVKWVNDKEDINFDGIPDLQIFLWFTAVGQVANSYTAYVWTPQGYFEEVKEWKELVNPQVQADSKTVAANYRSDANERTFETYKWKNGRLQLIKKERKKLLEE